MITTPRVLPILLLQRLESIERFLNCFADQPNETSINVPESNDGSVDTPLVSPFPHSDNDSDDEEVLNELSEYENTGTLRRERIINSFDGDDLAFECMIGFMKFTAYLDPLLPMNIISRKAYNTIMVDRLEGTRKNLVAIVRDVYVFVESFTYITNFVVLEGICEFIMSDMAEVLMGRPFRKTTKLKYDIGVPTYREESVCQQLHCKAKEIGSMIFSNRCQIEPKEEARSKHGRGIIPHIRKLSLYNRAPVYDSDDQLRVNNTAKTRRPHPRSNSNTDRVPSKSKSSCLSNNKLK
ncbi:hypothetical protein Tco_1015565 [Tanacetum coccineum]|uniref:Uncharacterized protein n=1 Tax=Tanacetum coccineum TaxID=301880 RepID=A0ABQ5FL58_9ASTR